MHKLLISLTEILNLMVLKVKLRDIFYPDEVTREVKAESGVKKSDFDNFVEYLTEFYAGEDVLVNMRTRKYRNMCSGFWQWNMTALKHVRVPRADIKGYLSPEQYLDYQRTVVRARIEWRNVLKGLARGKKTT